MNFTILLDKLIDLETSIGVETESGLRAKVLEAQECLLQVQSRTVELLRTQIKVDRATFQRSYDPLLKEKA